MMSNIGGQRPTLAEAVKHVYSLGGMRAYYRGLAVSHRPDRSPRTSFVDPCNTDRVARRVPVFRNRYEHLRGVEAGLCAVDRARGTWCFGPACFRQRFWKCRCNERVSHEPGSDEATGFWISSSSPTVCGHMGRDIKNVQSDGCSWVLRWPRPDPGKSYSGGFDILHGLRTEQTKVSELQRGLSSSGANERLQIRCMIYFPEYLPFIHFCFAFALHVHCSPPLDIYSITV